VRQREKTELRTLILSEEQKAKDYLAAAWSGKIVMVTGWWLTWMRVGFVQTTGEWLYAPVWAARIMEVPDRWFTEKQLMRIL
jgi:hypothetical protein